MKKALESNAPFDLSRSRLVSTLYRPFDRQELVFFPPLIEMLNQTRTIFGEDGTAKNTLVAFTDPTSQKPFMVMAADRPVDMHMVGAASGASCLPRHRYTPSGERLDNITDWALTLFRNRYGKHVTRDAIFDYCYAALHDPLWRETYAINLKRDFPRIPLHPDFGLWAEWGRRLLALHIGYEAVEPWPVERREVVDARSRKAGVALPVVLKSDAGAGLIRLDSETTLAGIPPGAWDYRLGNRAALD